MRTIILATILLAGHQAADAQRVKRKGVETIDVSKSKAGKQSQFTLPQLSGKWAEELRFEQGNDIAFKDTIWLNFPELGKAITKQGKTLTMTGEASIEPGDILLAAGDVYKIISIDENWLVLDNQDGLVHKLKKTERFSFEGKLP